MPTDVCVTHTNVKITPNFKGKPETECLCKERTEAMCARIQNNTFHTVVCTNNSIPLSFVSRLAFLSRSTNSSKTRSPTRLPMSASFCSNAGIDSTLWCEYWTISEKRNAKDAKLISYGKSIRIQSAYLITVIPVEIKIARHPHPDKHCQSMFHFAAKRLLQQRFPECFKRKSR